MDLLNAVQILSRPNTSGIVDGCEVPFKGRPHNLFLRGKVPLEAEDLPEMIFNKAFVGVYPTSSMRRHSAIYITHPYGAPIRWQDCQVTASTLLSLFLDTL